MVNDVVLEDWNLPIFGFFFCVWKCPHVEGKYYSVEPLDPLEGLYAAVTRKDRAGEPGDGWFPDQKLTMEEAIRLYTLDSAYAEFMEDRKGMIKTGYLADVVIFNNDLMTIPHDQIMKAQVDYTIVGGKVVYKRDVAY